MMDLMCDLCDLCALHAKLFRHSPGHSLGFVGYPCSICGNVIERGLEPLYPLASEQVGMSWDQDSQFIPGTSGSQLIDPITHFLPTELISQIFEMYVEYEYYGAPIHGPPTDPPVASPLPLAAVCQAWRRIAFSTPRLWTYVPIKLDTKAFASLRPGSMHSTGYEIARDWLARTGCLPLHIMLSKRLPVRPGDLIGSLFEVIYLVNSYSSRWQTLEVFLPKVLLGRLAQQLPGADGGQPDDILEALHIEVLDDSGESSEEPYTIEIPAHAPLQLSIGSIRYASLHLDWEQLTSLVSGLFFIDEVMEVIVNAPRLTECTMYSARSRDHPMFSSGIVFTHESLTKLVFRSEYPEVQVGQLLQLLVLPELDDLDIETEEEDGVYFLFCFTEFLRLSSPPIRNLVLSIPEIPLNVISEILYQLPSTRNLLLSRPFELEVWTELVASLGRPSPLSGVVLLPKLWMLAIEFPADAGPSVAGWDQIVETMKAMAADCAANFCRDVDGIVVLYSMERSEADIRDIKIPMRVSSITGLAEIVSAGIPFQVGLEPGSNQKIRCLDVLGLRDRLSAWDQYRFYQVDWYSNPTTVLSEYQEDMDVDEFDDEYESDEMI